MSTPALSPDDGLGASAPTTRPKRRRWLILIPLPVLFVVVIAHLHAAPTPPTVEVERREIVQRVVATGRVLAPATVHLAVPIQGVVTQVFVEEGQHISEGDALVQLDDSLLKAEAEEANAAVAEARALLGRLGAQDAELAQAELEAHDIEYRTARTSHGRVQQLVEAGAASPAEGDEADRELAAAKARRRAAELRVKATTSKGSETKLAYARLRGAKARAKAAAVRAEYSTLRSRADGVVLTRRAEPGEVATPNEPAFILARDGPVRLLIQPDERVLSTVRLGQTATVSTEAFPDKTFEAVVEWIGPHVNAERGTIDVRLVVSKPPSYLRTDMTVSATILVAEKEASLVVPREAVHDIDTQAPWIEVHQAEGEPLRIDVQLGLSTVTEVEIVADLEAGDRLVLPATATSSSKQKIHPWD